MLPEEKIKLIESCVLKAAFDMLSEHDIVKELERLVNEESKRRLGFPPPKDWTWEQSCLGFKFHRYSQLDQMSIVSFEYDNKFLCSVECDYSDERYGCIIRYKTIEKAEYPRGICVLYYEGKSNTDIFEYSGDGLNTKLVFKPIVNLIRNTINWELYQQLPKINRTVESNEEDIIMTDETKIPYGVITTPQFDKSVLIPGSVIIITRRKEDKAYLKFWTREGILRDTSMIVEMQKGDEIVCIVESVSEHYLHVFGRVSKGTTGIMEFNIESIVDGGWTISPTKYSIAEETYDTGDDDNET